MSKEDGNPYKTPAAPSPEPTEDANGVQAERQAFQRWFRFCNALIIIGLFLVLSTMSGVSLAGRLDVRLGIFGEWLGMAILLGAGMLGVGTALLLFGLFAIVMQALFTNRQ